MKTRYLLLSLLGISFSLWGCEKKDAPSNNSVPSDAGSTEKSIEDAPTAEKPVKAKAELDAWTKSWRELRGGTLYCMKLGSCDIAESVPCQLELERKAKDMMLALSSDTSEQEACTAAYDAYLTCAPTNSCDELKTLNPKEDRYCGEQFKQYERACKTDVFLDIDR